MSKILKQHERQQGNGAFRGTTFNEPRQRQHKATRGRLSGAVECHHGVGRESRGTSECTHHSAIPTSYPIDRIPETKTTRSSDRSEDESCTLTILTGLQAKGPSSPRHPWKIAYETRFSPQNRQILLPTTLKPPRYLWIPLAKPASMRLAESESMSLAGTLCNEIPRDSSTRRGYTTLVQKTIPYRQSKALQGMTQESRTCGKTTSASLSHHHGCLSTYPRQRYPHGYRGLLISNL